MSSFLSRWSVLAEHEVGADDRDATGAVSDAAVVRWVQRACEDYLAQCETLARRRADGLRVRTQPDTLPPGASIGPAAAVVVSASATEVLPEAFVISIRLRAVGRGDGGVGNAACSVTVVDGSNAVQPVDNGLRDELIALEHAARHFN
jgi:hypothetical protein